MTMDDIKGQADQEGSVHMIYMLMGMVQTETILGA